MPSKPSHPSPPQAKRIPVTIEQVGRLRSDPYQWMKDDHWQAVMQDPSALRSDIRAYLEAENAYTRSALEEPTQHLQAQLFSEMRGRIQEDERSLASIDGPFAYLTRYRTGGEYPIFARKPASDIYNDDAADDVLLDGDDMGAGKAYFSFGEVAHAPHHRFLAFAIDEQGSEFYDIAFKDLETGEILPDRIRDTYGDFVWGAASDRVYWIERNKEGRPSAVHMYVLGSSKSVEVYREADPGFFLGVDISQSGQFIFIRASNHTTTEYHYFDAADPTPKLHLVAEREPGIEYSVEHWGDRFVILTNRDASVDFKLVTAPVSDPSVGNWHDLVPHSPGTLILDMAPLRDHLIRLERHEGLPRLIITYRSGQPDTCIAFDEAAYELGMSTGYEYNTTLMRITYSSPSTPQQVFDYELSTGIRTLRKTQLVPSGHEPADYIVDRLMAPARDGAEVPVTILRHRETSLDGSADLLLYGYGSYGMTIPAAFRTTPLSLVNRGMIYAIVHPRGSMAKGYQWYLDGKLEKKTNTFNDYVDAAGHLISQNYTAQGKIVGMGGSAGGLLMGAVANLAPHLFAGIIAAVPFVDVINTMSDETLPLTPPEWPEWGNPCLSAADYDTIIAYSPYDQVRDQAYPPMLITGGLSDPRVTYWEPSKWAARLRNDAPRGGPYYLRINMEAGHGGASGRFEGLKETALEFAFALACVGKAENVTLEV